VVWDSTANETAKLDAMSSIARVIVNIFFIINPPIIGSI
jgi:hypothetical protein